jgi:hypothetical protein
MRDVVPEVEKKISCFIQESILKEPSMNRKKKSLWSAITFVVLSGLLLYADIGFGQAPGQRPRPVLPPIPVKGDTTHTLNKHFIVASNAKKNPDANGFIQRWLVLQPVRKEIPRNNILTEKYVRTAFSADNFSNDFAVVPKNDKTLTVGGQELKWYALDSKTFNFNLYHFTYAINEPPYGVLFWLVTVVNCPEEMKNVRMSAGVNSGGMFWLNGKEALILSGDRDMIVDNVTSPLLTLKKGKNIIRGAIINGPGMCNFAVRFLDEKGLPVTNFSVSYE